MRAERWWLWRRRRTDADADADAAKVTKGLRCCFSSSSSEEAEAEAEAEAADAERWREGEERGDEDTGREWGGEEVVWGCATDNGLAVDTATEEEAEREWGEGVVSSAAESSTEK